MKNFINKIKSLATKASASLAGVIGMMNIMAMTVYAADYSVNTGTTLDITTAGNKLLNIVINIVRIAGIILCVYGGFNFGMSFTQEDAERRTKGVLTLLAGIVIVAIPSVLTTLGVLTGA